MRRLLGHVERVTGLAWSPDRKILASASADGNVRLWDASTGLELGVLGEFPAENMLETLVFSSDGSILGGYGGRNYSPVILWHAPRVDVGFSEGRR